MEFGISTDFANEPWELEEIKNKLREIAEAGFTHIHWCFDWDGDYLYARSEMEQIRSWMDELGLKEKGLHASKGSRRFVERYAEAPHGRKDYLSELEPNRIAGVELIKNRVELVHVLGGKEIVLHMYLPTKSFEENPETKELFYQQACKSLDELQPYCKELGVKICLENLFEASAEAQIEQFDYLLDVIPQIFWDCASIPDMQTLSAATSSSSCWQPAMQTVSSASTYMTTGAGEKKMAAETHTVCRGNAALTGKKS